MNILTPLIAALPSRHWRELGRHFRNHRWERNDDGDILIAHAKIGGVFTTTAPDGLGEVRTHNLITTEGANYLLAAAIGGGTQSLTFYLAPFSGNVAVADTLTAANFTTTQTELTTQYSEANRPTFVESVPAGKATHNTANPAVVTAAVANVTLWGIGLLSVPNKASTSGVLLSAAKYASARVLAGIGDNLGIKYEVSLSNVT